MLNVLAEPESVNLSALAACPFHEMEGPNTMSRNAPPFRPGSSPVLRLGTRGSALALWQADHVQHMLESAGCRVEQERITTQGDRILDRPLAQIEGKSLFTRELDRALLEGRIDLAVHSLKDLPSRMPEGLVLGAVSRRENPFDAFIAHPDYEGTLDQLPPGATIATSSLRRTAQLKAWRPDLEIVPVRGNVDTRLARLDASSWQGIVLAAAGLLRLGLEDRIHTLFDTRLMVPAVGQGALGIVCAETNTALRDLLNEYVHDAETAACVRSERAFLAMLEGSCHVPVGALAQSTPEGIVLEGLVASLDGRDVIRDREPVDSNAPEQAGINLARRLLARGAAEILQLEQRFS
jgi:hydroxymethylbilane synthase